MSALNWTQLRRIEKDSASSQTLIRNLESFLSIMKDAETGQRGYLLTGNLSYLAPYKEAVASVPDQLRMLTLQLDSSTAASIIRISTAKLNELALTVRLHDQVGFGAALKEVNTGRGHEEMGALRNLIAERTDREFELLRSRQKEAQAQATRLSLFASGGSGLLFVFLCFSSLNIGRLASKREHVIAALKYARAQTEESRKTFEATLTSIGDAVITTDFNGEIVFMNSVAEQSTGWSLDDACGKPLHVIFHIVNESTRQPVESPVDKVRRLGTVVGLANHTVLIRRDGSEIPIDDSGAPIQTRSGNISGVVLVFRNIQDRRQAERALEVSERRYRQLADSMPQIVCTARPDGTIDYSNHRGTEFFGQDLALRVPFDWRPAFHDADLEKFQSEWNAALAEEKSFELECQMKSAVTGEYCWFLGRGVPLPNPSSHLTNWVVTFTDIDARKKIEMELRRANEDLSHFAFSASHDLQEPLRNVIIFTQLFARRQKGQLEPQMEEIVRLVVESAQRMETLIGDLLLYVRTANTSTGKVPVVEANSALSKALYNLQALIASTGATIQADELPAVPMEEVHLQQLFQNLISNSLKYRSEAPPLVAISARMQRDTLVFSVKDNGIGIDPQYRRHIFGLFKRLHGQSEYSGTGIGLAICEKIVERYGGRIWVDSQIGQGATFSFTLPGTAKPGTSRSS